MSANKEEVKDVKGFMPRAVKYAQSVDSGFANGISELYKSIWTDRENGLSMKQKHLITFSIACSKNNTDSAKKILERLKKFNATRQEIEDVMMIATWTSGVQNFTDFSIVVLEEMDRLGF
ncbi:carboxymuconolactone decarboxylase family protein [Methanosalsum natronophilum]|uniref:Carboxymuconolactone decarboxylase family protein n=1 Tax=Methanosalsum natronophilum TaxID=768733 RepID=A0A424YXQ4_9EURY|nr:carboxymuconolactone decarboxylase family protein [Methanosalsum natronophilum]MCS3923276.1 alkylhydroperoxidase/carboxymuconolactone decarboxylase family protein YurZ [Methanosalsum natronophilum]RQD85171.1 MAG: carboxymuconolactone decarboxylase family protein [Methanosalsum natronophilum]